VTSWFSPGPPRILAHRGLAIEAPENTLLAFLHALALGITHLETDVRATSDGVAVLSHDPDLERLTGVATPILALSSQELRRVRLPEGQEVATLREALAAFPDARFNIDIKSDEALIPTIESIRAERATNRVLVTSFDDRRRRAAVAALPGVATSASSRGVLAAAAASRLPFRTAGQRTLASVQALQVPERFHGVPIVTPRLLDRAHEHGVEVHVWTVNSPSDMGRLLAMGVDGLITDRADLALAVLRERAPDPL
jgi:glycerophosphoryl diester phosphodiesterase